MPVRVVSGRGLRCSPGVYLICTRDVSKTRLWYVSKASLSKASSLQSKAQKPCTCTKLRIAFGARSRTFALFSKKSAPVLASTPLLIMAGFQSQMTSKPEKNMSSSQSQRENKQHCPQRKHANSFGSKVCGNALALVGSFKKTAFTK